MVIQNINRRLRSFTSWVQIFVWIFTNRVKNLTNAADIKYFIDFITHMKKSEYKQLISLERYIGELILKIWPVVSPLPLFRYGPEFDSGYFVAKLENVDILISGGAGKNIDFELTYADLGTSVHLFDPYVSTLPMNHPKICHHAIKLQDSGVKKNSNTLNIQGINLMCNIDESKVNMLKLDIEGSEISLLGSENLNLSAYDQIVLEVHNNFMLTSYNHKQKFNTLIENLLNNHYVITFNANNNGLLLNFGKYFLPEVFEITLLHRKYFISNKIEKLGSEDLSNQTTNNTNRLALPSIFHLFDAINK